MQINDDFSIPAIVHSNQLKWQASPMPGVERRMLDRIGGEVARATSIVRYAPGSSFSAHVHSGGEEFLVLEGVFQDEHGDYPPGSYVRNPPQSKHTPGSTPGCTIFVKLWQFNPADRTPVRTHIDYIGQWPDPTCDGIARSPLFKDNDETVCIEHWAADQIINLDTTGGIELLVLEGSLTIGHLPLLAADTLSKHSWIRLPPQIPVQLTSGNSGARVWIKKGHLRKLNLPPKTPNT